MHPANGVSSMVTTHHLGLAKTTTNTSSCPQTHIRLPYANYTFAISQFSLFAASVVFLPARVQGARVALPDTISCPPIYVIPVLANRRCSVIIIPSGVTLTVGTPVAPSAFVPNTLNSLKSASTRLGSAVRMRSGDRHNPPPPRRAEATSQHPPSTPRNQAPFAQTPATRYTQPGTPSPSPSLNRHQIAP